LKIKEIIGAQSLGKTTPTLVARKEAQAQAQIIPST
jgi:hypothetical protein